MFVAVILICVLFNRPEVKHVDGVEEYVAEERRKLGGGLTLTPVADGGTLLEWRASLLDRRGS